MDFCHFDSPLLFDKVSGNLIRIFFFLVDILVCLVTMDAEAFGPEALSEVQILEKRIPTAMSATPKPQSASVPGQIKLYSIQEFFF